MKTFKSERRVVREPKIKFSCWQEVIEGATFCLHCSPHIGTITHLTGVTFQTVEITVCMCNPQQF